MQDADGIAGIGDVGGLEVRRPLNAKASPVEDGQRLAASASVRTSAEALAHRVGLPEALLPAPRVGRRRLGRCGLVRKGLFVSAGH